MRKAASESLRTTWREVLSHCGAVGKGDGAAVGQDDGAAVGKGVGAAVGDTLLGTAVAAG